MNHVDIFRRLSGLETDLRSIEEIWREISTPGDFVDSRDCGLFDAVQSGWYLGDTDELFRGFHISADDDVLDFGCGEGGSTLFCANRGASVIFIDVKSSVIDELAAKVAATAARKSTGIISHGTTIPLKDNSVTRVIATEVLEHVENPQETINELFRVGTKGALYLFSVPDPVAEKIQTEFAPPYYFRPPNHIHIFERNEFSDLIVKSGLEIVHRSYTGFFWTFWMFIYWALAKSTGIELAGESLDVAKPPYPGLLNDWAKLWHSIIKLPEAAPLKKSLDQLLPKSQIIVARKP